MRVDHSAAKGKCLLALLVLLTLGACSKATPTSSTESPKASPSDDVSTERIDPTKLPLGDGKTSSEPKKGSVFSCMTQFGGGGAFETGPWINVEEKTWDSSKKISVQGSVKRDSSFSAEIEGDVLHLKGNGIPPTEMGNFPVASSDPAYQYDRNPNSIKPYTLDASLPAEPKQAEEATCVGGTIGVSTLGAPIYSAFDAAGRDASAYETQDSCGGHPERTGQYHFHSLPACWERSDLSKTGLVGWALDGFGTFVERDADGNMLQTSDLDECHGKTTEIQWNGKAVNMYHYVATMDFPYLVGCYRGTPISSASGLNIGPPR